MQQIKSLAIIVNKYLQMNEDVRHWWSPIVDCAYVALCFLALKGCRKYRNSTLNAYRSLEHLSGGTEGPRTLVGE